MNPTASVSYVQIQQETLAKRPIGLGMRARPRPRKPVEKGIGVPSPFRNPFFAIRLPTTAALLECSTLFGRRLFRLGHSDLISVLHPLPNHRCRVKAIVTSNFSNPANCCGEDAVPHNMHLFSTACRVFNKCIHVIRRSFTIV